MAREKKEEKRKLIISIMMDIVKNRKKRIKNLFGKKEKDKKSLRPIIIVATVALAMGAGIFIGYKLGIVMMFKFIAFVSALLVIYPLFTRWLADRALFLWRNPEMYAAFFKKDKKLNKIVITCSDEEKLASLKKATQEDDDDLYVFVSAGTLVWIGLPWLGWELDSWYEHSKDDDNPEMDPHTILYLGERTWDYTTPETASEEEKKAFISEWGVDTKDPIQVTPKLVATVEVMHPRKTVYAIKYFQEAIQKEILTGWRDAVKTLEYFTYEKPTNGNGDKSAKTVSGVGLLHINAQKNLNKFLFWTEAVQEETRPEEYEQGSPAKMIYDIYGVWLKRVRIRDIDPTDPDIRDNLQAKLKAQTEAAAQVETAKGDRDSKMIRADGAVYETEKVGEAEANVIHMRYTAKASGLYDISDKLNLADSENKILFAAEMAIEMTKNSQYTYLAGMPGDIGTWIMAAADQMKGGMEKIKSDNGETKIGFEEIKNAFNGLNPDQKKKFLKLAEKTEGGGESK